MDPKGWFKVADPVRVLFVDDDPDILASMRAMLWSGRSRWQAQFAGSGAEAMTLMEASPFDVIVTDLRMPVMDGRELLAWVQRERPGIARVILSGQASLSTAIRGLAVTHRFLTKPTSSANLRAFLDQMADVLNRLPDPELRALLGGLGGLPTSERILEAIGRAITSAEIDLDRLASLIETDVGVTAKVLQVASSPLFGFERPATGIREAVERLGFQVVVDMLLAVELISPVPNSIVKTGHVAALSQIARATAILCRDLMPDPAWVSAAYTIGLLHNIGAIALGSLGVATAPELESVASAYLLSLWGLCPRLVQILQGPQPSLGSRRPPGFAEVLHVARYLAWETLALDLPRPPICESLLEELRPSVTESSLLAARQAAAAC